jgi:hypothetical protein
VHKQDHRCVLISSGGVRCYAACARVVHVRSDAVQFVAHFMVKIRYVTVLNDVL